MVFTPLHPANPASPEGITAEQLVAIMPNLSMDLARQYLPALDAAMREGAITTPARRAAFLAQLAHESCELPRHTGTGIESIAAQAPGT